ncbi:MAG: phenylalanine--tRNA ligase subunit alpha [Lachnospiraceae bacterium]|nr:phenylalanine--tRNA ligase subunit alpha [Lachnospiraceae bacterium]
MKEDLNRIVREAMEAVSNAVTSDDIEKLRVRYSGKKGEITALLKSLKDLPPDMRPEAGEAINKARAQIEGNIQEAQARIKEKSLELKLAAETIDVTLPGQEIPMGHSHPNTIALRELERIFIGMGYEVVEGPEVEKDYYNFEALNIPDGHPAKDEQDTFYINGDILLRTQTSSAQVHEMEKGRLPIRMISPGRVFRSDAVDATHSPSFHQVEGLVIDKGVTFSDLKGTLGIMARELFGDDTEVRFRPHHFPFTEPSAEMDVSCFKCGGKGCSFCKGEGWIEILGCGMVHPHVFEMNGIDPEEYTGFAFGVGLERIALLKYGIDDMRLMYENDIRFLSQF